MSLRLTLFRARIFGLALPVVGLIQLVVAAISWTGALSYQRDCLGVRLCEKAHRLVVRPAQEGGPARDAAQKLRLQSTAQLLS